jgi:hypothetical protein
MFIHFIGQYISHFGHCLQVVVHIGINERELKANPNLHINFLLADAQQLVRALAARALS